MSTVFAKPISENKEAISFTLIRIGMAFAFFGQDMGRHQIPLDLQ